MFGKQGGLRGWSQHLVGGEVAGDPLRHHKRTSRRTEQSKSDVQAEVLVSLVTYLNSAQHTKKNVFKSTGRRQEQWEGKHSAVREVCSWGLSKQICAGVALSCWIVMKGKSPLMVGGVRWGGWARQWRDDSESGGGGAAFNGFSLRRPSSRPPSPGSCSAALLQLSLRNCCRCFCHINLSYPPRKPLSNKTIQRGP